MAASPNCWLTRKEAAAFLGTIGCPISHRTLANMAAKDNAMGGPPFQRVRRKIVRYQRDDLVRWAQQSSVRVG
jgi:hypothetical protein